LNAALFGFYLLGIALSEDKATARFFVEKNLSLLAIPMVLLSMKRLTEQQYFTIGRVFVAGTCTVMLLATVLAVADWFSLHNYSVFFYHKLALHVRLSAIIASLLCMVSLAILFADNALGKWKWIVISALSGWLVLLSSKLFLVMLGVILFLNVLRYISTKARVGISLLLVLIVALITFTHNPVRKRFEDVGKFHTEYLSMKMYNPGMYFDGLSMRLIFVRFGLEIFREQGNYLLGVGTGDAEHLLKEKIKAYNMYQGDGVKDKAGYLQFGFHNQLLQKLLQLGLLGFAVFLATIVYCFAMAIKYKDGFLLNLILIFTLTFFTDTLLEHQVGLVMFLSFACMAIDTIRQRIKKNLALEQ
jgi:O-antigen ligase